MALVKCSECRRPISTAAAFCPHCGHPAPITTTDRPATTDRLATTGPNPQMSSGESPEGSSLTPSQKILFLTLGVVVALLLITALASPGGKRPGAVSAEPAAAAAPLAPTAAAVLDSLRRTEAAGDPVATVEEARALIRSFPNTPEADSAEAIAGRHEAAAAAERERQAEEAEQRRLALKWTYTGYKDEMTSRSSREARILSENTVSFDFPYEGPQHGRLTIRDHPSYGQDVLFRIEEGQILCRSYEDCTIRVRFDEGQAQNWRAVGPADNSSTVIFLRNQASFRRRMRNAKIVRLQVPVYQEGSPTFEFHVGGFDPDRFEGG